MKTGNETLNNPDIIKDNGTIKRKRGRPKKQAAPAAKDLSGTKDKLIIDSVNDDHDNVSSDNAAALQSAIINSSGKRKSGRPKKTKISGSLETGKPDPSDSVSSGICTQDNDYNSVSSVSVPVKRKRGRPAGTKNKTIRHDHDIHTLPGENTRFILHDLKLMKLDKIDVNNPSEVKQRIDDYISICAEDDIKPSVASLALSFGVNRVSLFNWLTGKNNVLKNTESINAIKSVYDMINSYYEHIMNNGKINPVAGIFLMKNNLGYKDTTDYIVSTGDNNNMALTDITNRAGLLDE